MAIGNISINPSISLAGVSFLGTDTSSEANIGINTGKDDNAPTVVSTGLDAHAGQSFQSKENTSAVISHIAWNISVADKTIGHINDLVSKMKANLTSIVKMYPPYPPGSQERARILKSYIGLRREIEQLTIPPEYQLARKILSNPSQVAGAGDQSIVLGQDGTSVTIHSQPVSPGPSGINIPELPINADDEQVSAAWTKINTAQELLDKKRDGLASDAYSVARTVEFYVKNTQINFSFSGQSVSADITEVSMGIKSTEVRQVLSSDSTSSLTGNNNESLKFFL